MGDSNYARQRLEKCTARARWFTKFERAPGAGAAGADDDGPEKSAEEIIAKGPGRPAFKGYRGYPCVLCTSVNSEIVHGIPSPKRKLREGDIVSLDFGMEVDGITAIRGDAVPVGKISPELQKLLDVTRESLDRAIDKMRPGKPAGRRGARVQSGSSSTAIRWCGSSWARASHEDA